MFKGTVRSNLDPFDQKTDEELWHALELVRIQKEDTYSAVQLKHELKHESADVDPIFFKNIDPGEMMSFLWKPL